MNCACSTSRKKNRPAVGASLALRAPAKINLFLNVLGRRHDGYHDLCSLMCCVGLWDHIHLKFDVPATGITCLDGQLSESKSTPSSQNPPPAPNDETNLALRAALVFHRALEDATDDAPVPLWIQLTKFIPTGAGLGGGSSDAATVLKGLNEYYGRPFDRESLMSLALGLGADVPFFVDARPALARGIGEKLTSYQGLAPMAVVLIYPGFSISTAQVYQNLNLRLTKCEKKIRNFSFKNGDFIVPDHLCNDLETAVLSQYPVIVDIKSQLMALGARGALMSGSGSTVFGLFDDLADAHRAADAFRPKQAYQVFVTEMLCP